METLADDLKQLPALMGMRMNELKILDKRSQLLMTNLKSEENKLLDELHLSIKSGIISSVEEIQCIEKSKLICDKRMEVLNILENQMRNIQNTYNQIDSKISYLDSCTKVIKYLLPQSGEEEDIEGRKKKETEAKCRVFIN